MIGARLRGKNVCQSYLVTQTHASHPRVVPARRSGPRGVSDASIRDGRCATAASESRPRCRLRRGLSPYATTASAPRLDSPSRTPGASSSDAGRPPEGSHETCYRTSRTFDASFFWAVEFIGCILTQSVGAASRARGQFRDASFVGYRPAVRSAPGASLIQRERA